MTQFSPSVLARLGEFGLISRMTAGVAGDKGVITGIGDDAAVTALSAGMQLLTSTDMLLEDVHFRRAWHDPFQLGRKSLAVSISDLAAMGAIPRWALLSLAIPSDLTLDFIDEFMRGFFEMASEHQVVLIGGDTCATRSGLTVSVTVMGEQYPDMIVRRSGAVPDDDIWVTGTVGDAALGLTFVEAGNTSSCTSPTVPRSLDEVDGADGPVSRLLDPVPRVSIGRALAAAGLANAMVDVSDGLIADYGHIAEQSGVGGRLYLETLPLSPRFRSYTAQLATIPYHLALTGGEDYELCFTASRDNRGKIIECAKKCGIAVTRIGIVTNSLGVVAVTPEGTPYHIENEGFNHFI